MKTRFQKKGSVKIFLTIVLASITFAFIPNAHISKVSADNDILNRLDQAVGNLLPNYRTNPHPESVSGQPGVTNIGSAILFVTDFLKLVMGTIAIIYLIVAAIRLITAGDKIEDILNKEKTNLSYIIIGLLVIIFSTSVINGIISETGEIDFLSSNTRAQDSGLNAQEHIRGIYNFIEAFIGAIAILMIVASGMRMILSGGNEETLKSGKQHIIFAAFGLMIIGISEFFVKDFIFASEDEFGLPGTEIGYSAFLQLAANITNFVSGFITFFAILSIIYAGFLYVTSAGEQENIDKAKKIIFNAVIGLVVAAAAYAIVNTLIALTSR